MELFASLGNDVGDLTLHFVLNGRRISRLIFIPASLGGRREGVNMKQKIAAEAKCEEGERVMHEQRIQLFTKKSCEPAADWMPRSRC